LLLLCAGGSGDNQYINVQEANLTVSTELINSLPLK
jgi:hypothetical protein